MRVLIHFSKALILSCCALTSVTFAEAQKGAALYATCSACHGDKAQGNDALKAPALAGQYEWYLERQLQHFQNKLRGSHPEDSAGQQMLAFSAQLGGDDIKALSRYLSSMPPTASVEVTSQGDMMNGSRYYHAKCGACHGGEAQGNKAFNAPALANLSEDYLARQMDNFANGIRGTHKDDKPGRQMAMMAKTVSGKELEDIIHFITQQGSQVK